jgi:hypothetical protein
MLDRCSEARCTPHGYIIPRAFSWAFFFFADRYLVAYFFRLSVLLLNSRFRIFTSSPLVGPKVVTMVGNALVLTHELSLNWNSVGLDIYAILSCHQILPSPLLKWCNVVSLSKLNGGSEQNLRLKGADSSPLVLLCDHLGKLGLHRYLTGGRSTA